MPSLGARPIRMGAGPSNSRQEVSAIAHELARVKGPTFAGKLIQQHGGGKLALMPKEKYAAFIVAAEVMLREAQL
jgi:hypothetical protein